MIRQTCATLCAAMLAAMIFAPQASAGIMTWGCKGRLGTDRLIFDRYSLVVMPPAWASERTRDLIKGNIATFAAKRVDEGLLPTMEYVHSQYEGQKLTLTEKSSRTIFSRDRRRADRREESTLVTRKIYRYERTDEKPRRYQNGMYPIRPDDHGWAMRRTAAVAIHLLIGAPDAEAAVWRWGCMGHTGIYSIDLTAKGGRS
jgi:hypothetical protein